MGLSGSQNRQTVLTRLTPEQREDAVGRYLRGDPVAVIVIQYDLNYNSFYKLLKEMHVELRDRSPEAKTIRNARFDLAIKLYMKGMAVNQIEVETGVRQPQLHREIVLRGIPMRRPTSPATRAHLIDDLDIDLSELTDQDRAVMFPEADAIPIGSGIGKYSDKEKDKAREEGLEVSATE
jgi:hypothetical protein